MRLPLLAANAALSCCGPLAFGAISITDNDLTLTFGMDVEQRAQLANASTGSVGANSGEPFDVFRQQPGKSNEIDFNTRRARLLINGTYTDSWRFNLSFNADNVDRNGDNGVGTSNGAVDSTREVQLFKAYLRHIWKIDEDDRAYVQGGLDFAFFNRAIADNPLWLFPGMRVTGNLMGNRAVGARAMLSGALFDWGFEVDESMDPVQATATSQQPGAFHHEGLFYATRLEYTVFSDNGAKAAYREDYQGRPGHSLMLTGDIGYDNADYGLAGTRTNAYCYGFEALYHHDGLSMLVEGRAMHTKETAYAGGGLNQSVLSEAFCAQAGYAFPAMGITVEPALRAQRLNLNTKVDEQASYNNANTTIAGGGANTGPTAAALGLPAWLTTFGAADRMNSGNIFDVGVNWIFNSSVWLQTSYTRWNGEAGQNGSHPDANILRAQLQLYF